MTKEESERFERWQKIKEEFGSEGPLKAYQGASPEAPAWFSKAIAVDSPSKLVDVEGASIHYLQWGERDRPGLLLVHGNGAHARWWSFVAPYFAADYNVAALDLSGMGDSGRREDYTVETYSKELMAVAEASGMFEHQEPPIILAHSFGGLVSIHTGALYGDQLAGVIIVDSPVNPPDRPGGPPERKIRPHRPYPTQADALARFRLMPPQGCDNHYLVDFVARHSITQTEDGWIWKFDPKTWQRFYIGDVAERLKQISCRIGILRGENSLIFPHEVGEYMFNLLGRAVPVIEIPEAQHHVMLDQPLAFIAAIRALLEDWNHSHPVRQIEA
jgi:pimeloyl-ACP methyl ester carboxylesterase